MGFYKRMPNGQRYRFPRARTDLYMRSWAPWFHERIMQRSMERAGVNIA